MASKIVYWWPNYLCDKCGQTLNALGMLKGKKTGLFQCMNSVCEDHMVTMKIKANSETAEIIEEKS